MWPALAGDMDWLEHGAWGDNGHKPREHSAQLERQDCSRGQVRGQLGAEVVGPGGGCYTQVHMNTSCPREGTDSASDLLRAGYQVCILISAEHQERQLVSGFLPGMATQTHTGSTWWEPRGPGRKGGHKSENW